MGQTDLGFAFNRNGTPYAEKRLFYEQCKLVPDEKPLFISVAINNHRDEGRFLEVMESIIISILDLFDRGRLTPWTRQVNLAKSLRPSGLPQRNWIPGSASSPVCMGYNPKLTPEVQEDLRERALALSKVKSEDAVRSETLARALEREKQSLNKYTWCFECGLPLEAHHWSDHVKTKSHQEKSSAGSGKLDLRDCATCGQKDILARSWNEHTLSTRHQNALNSDKQSDKADRWCDYCAGWFKSASFHTHEKSKGHRKAMVEAGVTPTKEAQKKKWCGICKQDRPSKDFARHERENKKHLENLRKMLKKEDVDAGKL